MPVEIIPQSKMTKTYATRRRLMQQPITDFVFRQIDCRHEGQNDIMQCNANGSGDFVAIKEPGNTNREQGFHAPKRRESKKNADGHTEGD